jgi:hypothetical protein
VAELTGVIPASARINAVLAPVEGCEDMAQWANAEDEDLVTFTTLLADHEEFLMVDRTPFSESNTFSRMFSAPLSGTIRS